MNKPTRTPAIDALAANLMICLVQVSDIAQEAEETNAALAFCELAVSLPPEWFSRMEREIVVAIITQLYGDPRKFINELSEGNISYYNHMIAKMRDKGEKKAVDLDDAVMGLVEMHTEKFGAPVI